MAEVRVGILRGSEAGYGDIKRVRWRCVVGCWFRCLKKGWGLWMWGWDEGLWSEIRRPSFASVFDIVCVLSFGLVQEVVDVGIWGEVKVSKCVGCGKDCCIK